MSAEAVASRAAGVAAAVVARQTAAHGRDLLQRPAEQAGKRPDEVAADHRHGDEHEHGAEGDGAERDVVLPGPYMPADDRQSAEDRDHHGGSVGVKRANRDGGSCAPSWSAAMGGTRVARCAGTTAESSVTTMPTASATTIVRGCQHQPAVRDVDVRPPRRACRMPAAIPSPATMPSTEASSPMTSASPVMLAEHLAREAPRARSIANSRRRWATVIENALKMMKAPTSTAMPPKQSRTGRRKPPMASLICLGLVGGRLRARLDLGVGGQRRPDRSAPACPPTRRLRLGVDLGDAALHVEPALRVGQRGVTSSEPPSDDSAPNVNTPTTVRLAARRRR